MHRLVCGSFTKDHNVSKTGSVSVLRWMGQDRPIQLGPSERAGPVIETRATVEVFDPVSTQVKVKVKVTLRLTVGQSVSLGVKPPSGAHNQIFITVWQLRSCFCGAPCLSRGRVCLCICVWCWPLPAQSFSGPSPLVLATIFYCLRFETSFFVASYDSQGHGGGIRPHLYTATGPHYIAFVRTPRKTPLPTILLLHDVAIGTDGVENTASQSYSTFACYTAVT
jgi:hypothetical protein